jgi:hypothetical protein
MTRIRHRPCRMARLAEEQTSALLVRLWEVGWMEDLEAAVVAAEARLAAEGWSTEASAALKRAEIGLAEARGEEFAEVIDLGVHWNTGAPIPHLVSNGSRATLICFVSAERPAWDGTNPMSIDAASDTPMTFAVIEFQECHAVLFGGPSDESLPRHPLYRRGLSYYAAHEVHNSLWLDEQIRVIAPHPKVIDSWRALRHYFLTFHDETFEALARTATARIENGTMGALLEKAARASLRR